MTDDLKPCPFCGGEAKIVRDYEPCTCCVLRSFCESGEEMHKLIDYMPEEAIKCAE